MDFSQFSNDCLTRLDQAFHLYLSKINPAVLREAIQHSLISPGKKIRPLLVYAAGVAVEAPFEALDIPAAAVEMIHTYSLIHDDLPAMDNADLRRGRPTCHKVYGDAMAILAGDGLQALAFDVIAEETKWISEHSRLQMVKVLSRASGPHGMVAGQALDISVLNKSVTAELLEQTYRLKTGALLAASIELGLLAGPDVDITTSQILKQVGVNIGAAFQIQDDLLDIEKHPEMTGKPQGLDVVNEKMTYPLVFGVEEAKRKVEGLFEEAVIGLDKVGPRAEMLREIVVGVWKRER